ncbi:MULTISPECIES: hypothetical protein [Rhodococcus]|uniref:Uncharacterized protein n=2 Tax=Rhodococcus qingshengii TaxID=334542 RepID=A0AB38R6H2_RHOSG|nr:MULTISPECIES: hypothetical protein [Rhodococcus]UPU40632.1 hypothetical protein M0639_16245 [Rhodococcus qingshengii JCM 15477]UPU45847.1 hypothetical protein M0639_14625 [Rhodococcus qingshengii JCM 15477]UPU46198.1 hypothetical protein M0639_30050 [Rhodococcus qingshengii JCM 15477]UPU46268.1 hypothetical protein M0639_30425 [Rhodococcus qingshengii JCM 15477]UPU46391.1 hypothetical protein M0639_30990 [Rhodococcus qingshengii JCM 15477]
MAITLEDTLAAISLLQNTEKCARISGTAEYRRWPKNDIAGPPNRVDTVHFSIDNELGSWSQRDTKSAQTRRYSSGAGQELVDDDGQLIPPKPPSGFDHWPLLIKMMTPSRFPIWGRPGDKWRMKGAESTEHGYLLHLNRDTSPAEAELYIDTTFSLPIRWTDTHQVRPDLGAKQEVEIVALHIPPEWKRLTGMDMSEEGQDMAG